MKKKIAAVILVSILAVGSGVAVSALTASKPKPSGCSTEHKSVKGDDSHGGNRSNSGTEHKEDDCGSEKKVEHGKSDSCNPSHTAPSASVKDTTPVATVNGVSIMSWVYNSAVEDKRESGDTSTTIKEDILDNLITVELLYQEAKKSGIALQKGAGTMRADAVRRAQKDPKAFDELLAKRGLSSEDYHYQWYRQATINLYIEEQIEASVVVKDKTLKKLYKKLNKANSQSVARSFEESRSILRELYVKDKTRSLLDKKIAVLKNSSDIVIL